MEKFLLAGLLLFCYPAFSQTVATTEDGRKVILHENGSWSWKSEQGKKTAADYTCQTLLFEEYDKMNGITNFRTKEAIKVADNAGTGLEIQVWKNKYNVTLSILAPGAEGCMRAMLRTKFLFRDGTRIELDHDGEDNCDTEFRNYFMYTSYKIKELGYFAEKEVETIRVVTTDGYVQKDLSPGQSQKLQAIFKCLEKVEFPEE